MKPTGILAIAMFALAAMAWADAADARIGGGKSLGAQRPGVAPRASAPPAAKPPGAASQPVMPAQPGATLPARAAAPAAPQASGASRWLGPLAGVAAGLGLAALLSHFGLPEGFGTFLLLALLVIGGVFVLRMLVARRAQATQRPLAYAGAPDPAGTPAALGTLPPSVWGGAPRVEPVLPPPVAAVGNRVPPGFDVEAFVRHAKSQFIRLQAAHDTRDRAALAEVMTPELYGEVERDLDRGTAGIATKIYTLEAELLEVETEADRHWASIRFTGTLREGVGASISAFDEIWNLTKPADGSYGWLLAGVQQTA